MRTTTVSNKGITTNDVFTCILGPDLINCFGEFLPYNILYKYSDEQRKIKLSVRMSVYEGVDIMIIIDGINVYNSAITHDECSTILLRLDSLRDIISN